MINTKDIKPRQWVQIANGDWFETILHEYGPEWYHNSRLCIQVEDFYHDIEALRRGGLITAVSDSKPELENKLEMTLRQWYAGQAMSGLIAGDINHEITEPEITKWAFGQADAMIAFEENKRKEQAK